LKPATTFHGPTPCKAEGPTLAPVFYRPACTCTTGHGNRIGATRTDAVAIYRGDHPMAKEITIEHVFKVFGDAPQAALELVRQGCSKQEILARTGQSIGVFDAHFTIGAGEIFVVMGLSGSGKSTLVRILNRLIEPTAGRVLIDGVDLAPLPDAELRALRRKDISMVF